MNSEVMVETSGPKKEIFFLMEVIDELDVMGFPTDYTNDIVIQKGYVEYESKHNHYRTDNIYAEASIFSFTSYQSYLFNHDAAYKGGRGTLDKAAKVFDTYEQAEKALAKVLHLRLNYESKMQRKYLELAKKYPEAIL